MSEATHRIIEYLNNATGSLIASNDPKAVFFVNRILQEHSEADIQRVIDFKTRAWKNTKYAQYLRPQTLFGDKFKTYLNESRTTKDRFGRITDSVERAKSANWKMDNNKR
jgi:uncharacterized phage protein (TIGR02220 family)